MKKSLKRTALFASLLFASSFTVVACQPAGQAGEADFNFSIELSTGSRDTIYLGEEAQILIRATNKSPRTYTYESDDTEYISVDDKGNLLAKKVTPEGITVGISVFEPQSYFTRTLYLNVRNRSTPASGGYSYASDTEKRTEILGELEEFAMKNFLTGLSLFENGGYVRYSPRFKPGTENYITGFGFGMLSDGTVVSEQEDWLNDTITKWRSYYHSGSSQDPIDINAWMASGSQVADLNGYISSSFYGTKINPEAPTKYMWYPVLADDDYAEPVAIDKNGNVLSVEESANGSYKKWRIYVKTGNASNGVAYHTVDGADSALVAKYDNAAGEHHYVRLEDYEFTFKMLLTGATKLKRGSELAEDTSYGFKNAYSYWKKTQNYTDGTEDEYDLIEDAWKTFKNGGGFQTSADIENDDYEGKPYLQFEFINPLDQFNAKYTLSSNLYSPLPEDFINGLSDKGWIGGATVFGRFDGDSINNRVLCLGPYRLEEWNKNVETVFQRNTDWFEYARDGRYQIPGVHISYVKGAGTDPNAVYNEFMIKKLDACGIPSKDLKLPTDKKTQGDSTFKLNVNSCTQERWNELFGEDGKITTVSPAYDCKPWMANKNFLKGLFWSIDRRTFGEDRNVEGSYNYFANAYLSDPAGESYNSTLAHEKALKGFDENLVTSEDPDTRDYGYNEDFAVKYFASAVSELVEDGVIELGTPTRPTTITIQIWWMNSTDETEYGEDIEGYFTKAFNNPDVSNGCVVLDVLHDNEALWEDVYNMHLMKGVYDLGFGAISGNSLNPLNFMEVLKSDNSSGFTLNWGADTGKRDSANPIVYDGKEWTYDSLWAAGDHAAVVEEGVEAKIVKDGYISDVTKLDGTGFPDNFAANNGAILHIPFRFNEKVSEGVSFDIDRIQLYLIGAGTVVIDEANIKYLDANGDEVVKGADGKIDFSIVREIVIKISKEFADSVNDQIFNGNKSLQKEYDDLSDEDKQDMEKVNKIKQKFRYSSYYSTKTYRNSWWAIEIYYNINIEGYDSTQSEYDVLKNEDELEPSAKATLLRI